VARGVAPAKIAMGIPFYGRGEVCNGSAGLNAPTVQTSTFAQPDGPIITCADFINWPAATWAGVPYYSYLRTNTPGWIRAWDTNADVPYLTSGNYFLSYEDSHSVGLKARFVHDQNLGGVIVWDAFGDVIPGPVANSGDKLPFSPTNRAPLINVINSVLAGDPVPADGTEGPAAALVPIIFTSVTCRGQDITLAWQTAAGHTNWVQAGGLAGWTNLSGPLYVPGSGSAFTNWTDVRGATNGTARFYRVLVD
jgi:hypothetical protein